MLPITIPLVSACVILLTICAGLSKTFAWIAGRIASFVVLTVLWQRSTILLKLIMPSRDAE